MSRQRAAEIVPDAPDPTTELGLVETARRGGHTAPVHTAAASNFGQMLLRVCRVDGLELVNVVRARARAGPT